MKSRAEELLSITGARAHVKNLRELVSADMFLSQEDAEGIDDLANNVLLFLNVIENTLRKGGKACGRRVR